MTVSSQSSTELFRRSLVEEFLSRYPIEGGRVIARLHDAEAAKLIFSQEGAVVRRLLERLNPDDAARIFAVEQPAIAQGHLADMDPLRAAAIVARLTEKTREALLAAMPAAPLREIRAVLAFPEGTAGRMMDRRVSLHDPGDTAEQALLRLRRVPGRRVLDLMLVNGDGVLIGSLPLHVVATALPDALLGQLAVEPPVSVHSLAGEQEVVELIETYRLTSVAVVDLDGRLIGVIRHDELLSAVQEDAVSAAQAMVGVSREERALSSPLAAIRSRLPWLQINLLTAFLASAVVGLFDVTIAKITALAVLMPVVAGQAGNTGAQALAVTQRGLALGEIRTSHVWSLIRKEAIVGAGAGVAVSLVTALGVFVWSGKPALAGVIAVSMVFSMSMAAVSGAVIPIVLTALGRDPATASSIVLTTITDIVGFFSFLGLSSLLVGSIQ